MAYAGMHPVVAMYSTFLNRAFDQVLMDCALHRAGVTFVLDRAGVTGDDGASHNGMWDLAMLRIVPGLRLCTPRDEVTLREGLRRSVDVVDGPSVIRFPKGSLPDVIPAVQRLGSVDVLRAEEHPDITIVALGAMAGVGLDVATRLGDQGLRVRVVDPCWALPIDVDLVHAVGSAELVVTIEDGLRDEGIGAALGSALAAAGYAMPILNFGLPKEFLQHAKRAEILTVVGLTGQEISRTVVETAVRLGVGEKIQETSTESDSATP
jgi:1-deoxy-D-xylulose-5-phosphate synthase